MNSGQKHSPQRILTLSDIDIKLEDTLKIRMNRVEYDNEILVFNATHLIYNDQDELKLLNDDLRLNISESPKSNNRVKNRKRS